MNVENYEIDRYAWDLDFRNRILALAVTAEWYTKYGDTVIKPEYFQTTGEVRFAEFTNWFYKKFHRPPDEDESLAEFYGDEETSELIPLVYDCLELDLSYAETRAIEFARQQAMRIALSDSIDLLESGDLDQIHKSTEKASKIGLNVRDMGLDIRNISEWAVIEEDEKIPTGMGLVDEHLEGGLGRGEYGLVMAGTNVGKTKMLVNIGVGAMSIMGRANVLHVSCEEREKVVARRYGARIANKWASREESVVSYSTLFTKKYNSKIYGKLMIKYWPSGTLTVTELGNFIDLCQSNGFSPDLIIVDYPDIMHHTKVGEYRHNLTHTTTELRALAERFDAAMWAATQGNRSSLQANLVDLTQIAEDVGKAREADVVLTLNQTREEYQAGEARIFAAKVRGAGKYWQVACKVHEEAHAIIPYQFMTAEEVFGNLDNSIQETASKQDTYFESLKNRRKRREQ